ncbi:PLP-dependent aminotransferase family protein [Rarobacter faecitabidus]
MHVTVSDLVEQIAEPSPRGIAAGIARLMRAGELRPGDRLPTVRSLSAALGVSPATVSGAWHALADVGLVVTRGRAGTFVLPEPASWLPPRYRTMNETTHDTELDLSTGTPDPRLLPSIGRALVRAASRLQGAETGSYVAAPVLPELEALIRETWPFTAQRITVVDGALDALARAVEQATSFGDRIAVENPGFPPVFDLLEQAGRDRVLVELDEHGITPPSLESALRKNVTALIVQPRAHNPTGVSISPTRGRELAAILRQHPGVTVFEDDHSGDVSAARDFSLGTLLPMRVVRIRSYSKSHGPDLRIAAIGGPAAVIDPLVARRMLGPGWTSRLLQRVLIDLLTDADAMDAVTHARRVYYSRSHLLTAALAAEGIEIRPGDGINMWLPVHDEQVALTRLASASVSAAPGTPFFAARDSEYARRDHIRISLSTDLADVTDLARVLAHAARP